MKFLKTVLFLDVLIHFEHIDLNIYFVSSSASVFFFFPNFKYIYLL